MHTQPHMHMHAHKDTHTHIHTHTHTHCIFILYTLYSYHYVYVTLIGAHCMLTVLLDMSSPTWPVHRKHIFILSKSGKPVYARYGCEEKLVGLFGIMQALISIVEDGNDVLR